MNEFKRFITVALMAIALILTCAASAGAINFGLTPDGGSFYVFAGICNLGWCYPIIREFIKRFIKTEKKEDK